MATLVVRPVYARLQRAARGSRSIIYAFDDLRLADDRIYPSGSHRVHDVYKLTCTACAPRRDLARGPGAR